MLNTIAAPDHLSVRSQAVWQSTLQTHELRPDELELLDAALTQLDRATEARRHLDEDGLLVAGLHGPRLNPLLAVERHSSAAGARLLRQLGLTDSEGDGGA